MKRISPVLLWLCACGSQASRPTTSGAGAEAGNAKPGSAAAAAGDTGAAAPDAAAICLDEAKLPPGYGARTVAAVEGGLLRICREQRDDDDKPLRACVALDLATGKPSKAADTPLAPLPEIVAGKFETRDGKPVACASDGTCRPVGMKFQRYLMSFKKGAPAVSVTSDGEVVMAANQAWSVRKDRRLTLAAPRDIDPEYVKWGDFSPVGRFVLGAWTPCAGPCTVKRLFAPDGKVVIDSLETEDQPYVLDATTWGLHTSKLEVFELATGKRLRQIEVVPETDPPTYTAGGVQYLWDGIDLGDDSRPVPIIPLPEGRAAIVFYDEPVVVIVSVAHGKLESRIRIPICGNTDAEDDAELLKD